VFVTDSTQVIIDINGYFVPESAGQGLSFYPKTPCRVADTREAASVFGGPRLSANQTRDFPIPQAGCTFPAGAGAYSLNATVVPAGNLGFLTLWPAGQPRPFVSTLNSLDGSIVANAALVPSGSAGAISALVTDDTHLVLDGNGYFGQPGSAGALRFFPVFPCRVADTREASGPFGGPVMAANSTRDIPIPNSACGIPATAQAYSLNVTVVPREPLGFLTVWPAGASRPFVSTLNSLQGKIVANAAIVSAGNNGAISVFVTNQSDVIVDINGYFAP
jgi:hypothetical protein